jgi:dienelactone hydrolase
MDVHVPAAVFKRGHVLQRSVADAITSVARRSLLALVVGMIPITAAISSEIQYSEIFYRSGDLNIQAYLYQPEGAGPFPVVIYNHGSRGGRESDSVPFEYVGAMLTRAGYIVLVPERRGYGKSDGLKRRDGAGRDQSQVVTRLYAETDDVLAAIAYLRTVPSADTNRLGIMGWSFGGIVTMFATSRSAAFAAAVNQAGGALTWDSNAHVRKALLEAAESSTTPTLFMVARNDRTTSSITALAEIFKNRGIAQQTLIYDAFTPERGAFAAPGHALFSEQGAHVWESDLLQFLGRYLKGAITQRRDDVDAASAPRQRR